MPCKIEIKKNLTKSVDLDSEEGLNLNLNEANKLANKVNKYYNFNVVRFMMEGDFVVRDINIPSKLVDIYYENELKLEEDEAIELSNAEKERGGYTEDDRGEFFQISNVETASEDSDYSVLDLEDSDLSFEEIEEVSNYLISLDVSSKEFVPKTNILEIEQQIPNYAKRRKDIVEDVLKIHPNNITKLNVNLSVLPKLKPFVNKNLNLKIDNTKLEIINSKGNTVSVIKDLSKTQLDNITEFLNTSETSVDNFNNEYPNFIGNKYNYYVIEATPNINWYGKDLEVKTETSEGLHRTYPPYLYKTKKEVLYTFGLDKIFNLENVKKGNSKRLILTDNSLFFNDKGQRIFSGFMHTPVKEAIAHSFYITDKSTQSFNGLAWYVQMDFDGNRFIYEIQSDFLNKFEKDLNESNNYSKHDVKNIYEKAALDKIVSKYFISYKFDSNDIKYNLKELKTLLNDKEALTGFLQKRVTGDFNPFDTKNLVYKFVNLLKTSTIEESLNSFNEDAQRIILNYFPNIAKYDINKDLGKFKSEKQLRAFSRSFYFQKVVLPKLLVQTSIDIKIKALNDKATKLLNALEVVPDLNIRILNSIESEFSRVEKYIDSEISKIPKNELNSRDILNTRLSKKMFTTLLEQAIQQAKKDGLQTIYLPTAEVIRNSEALSRNADPSVLYATPKELGKYSFEDIQSGIKVEKEYKTVGIVYSSLSKIPGIKISYEKLENSNYELIKVDISEYTTKGVSEFQYKNTSVEKPDEKLNEQLKYFLDRLGIKLEAVDAIKDKDGNPISAIARTSILKKIIEVVEDKADITTLPEETAHFFTALLGMEHPLMKSMMRDVVNYPEYAEVKNDPQYSAQFGDNEAKYRFEAVGKVLAKEIIGQFRGTKTQEARVKGFWKSLWEKIKKWFNGAKSSEITQMQTAWKLAADKILNADARDLSFENAEETVDYLQENEFFQKDPITQEANIKNIEDNAPKYNSAKEKYTFNGKDIKNRVSQIVNAFYKSIFPHKTVENTEESKFKAGKGQVIHAINQYIVKQLAKNEPINKEDAIAFAKESTKDLAYFATIKDGFHDVSNAQFDELTREITKLINRIKQFDPDAKFLTEAAIYDKKRDIAGTIDLLIAYSDGSIGLYDWKSFDMTDEIRRFGLPFYKEQGYDEQLIQYKRILAEAYGITKFRESRVVPIALTYNRDKGQLVDKGLNRVEIDIDGKDIPILRVIPVANELTEDEDINKQLERLFKHKSVIRTQLAKDKQNEDLKARLYKIDNTIKTLQLKQDITVAFRDADDLARTIAKGVAEPNSLSRDYINAKRFGELKSYLTFYKEYVEDLLQKFAEIDPKKAASVTTNLALAEQQLTALGFQRAYEESGVDIKQAGTSVGFMKEWFQTLSKFDQPLIKAFRNILFKAQQDMYDETIKLLENIKTADANLRTWASNNGMSVSKAFEKIINPNTKDLITAYKAEIYQKKEELQKSGHDSGIKWMKENFEFDKDGYEQFKTESFIRFEQNYAGDLEKIEREKDSFEMKFDASKHSKAWLNSFNFFIKPKELEENFNEQWIYLNKPENKALKEYYDMHTSLIELINESLPHNTKLKKNFVANIRKDLVQRFTESGKLSVGGLKQSFLNSLELRDVDPERGGDLVYDPNTGQLKLSVPLLFVDQVKEKLSKPETLALVKKIQKDHPELEKSSTEFKAIFDSEKYALERAKGKDNKSLDLTSNLIIFAEAAMNYKHMSEIEDQVSLLKELSTSADIKEKLTDKLGNVIKDNGKILERYGLSTNTIETFNKFVNLYIYGQTDQGFEVSKIKIGEVKDEEGNVWNEGVYVSGNKVARKLMQWLSMKAIGANPIIAGQNIIGSNLNALIKGTEGVYFKRKQWHDSFKKSFTNDEKFNFAKEFFNVHTHNFVLEQANNLSASKINATLTTDKLFLLHKKPDEWLDNVLLYSMMQNYGLNSEGKPERLVKLPQGTKSLADSIEVVDDKLQIVGLSQDGFHNFRRQVQNIAGEIKGNMSAQDRNLVGTTIQGQIIMQFRNWMPKLIESRGRALGYNDIMDEFDEGRFRVFFEEVFSRGLAKAIPTFLGTLKEVAGFSYKANKEAMQIAYDKFISDNPEFEDKLSPEQYLEMRQAKLKSMAMEMRIYTILLAMILMASGGKGDDDKKKAYYKRSWASRQLYNMLVRGAREIGFFFSISTAKDITKSAVPLTGLFTDIGGLLNAIKDESIVAINPLGKNEKVINKLEKSADKRFGRYMMKLFPLGSPGMITFELFGEEKAPNF